MLFRSETLRRRLFTRQEDQPEGFSRMPIHCIAANKSPTVFKKLELLSPERAAELGVDLDAALANVPDMRDVLRAVDLPKLLQVAFARPSFEGDPEEALYAGFIGNDRRTLDWAIDWGDQVTVQWSPEATVLLDE